MRHQPGLVFLVLAEDQSLFFVFKKQEHLSASRLNFDLCRSGWVALDVYFIE
jgi:hypothetical protein